MAKELVVFDNGVETPESYDPVDEDTLVETDTAWTFEGWAGNEYTVEKKEGRTIVIREFTPDE